MLFRCNNILQNNGPEMISCRFGVFIINFEHTLHLIKPINQMILTLSWRRSLSYRNQIIDLLWFLYHRDLCHERVNLSTKPHPGSRHLRPTKWRKEVWNLYKYYILIFNWANFFRCCENGLNPLVPDVRFQLQVCLSMCDL